MPDLVLATLVIAVWLAIGLASVIVFLIRRGRRNPLWLLVGGALGPLMTPIAWEMTRNQRTLVVDREPDAPTGSSREPTLTVLVGLDESPESRQALDAAVELLGTQSRRLVLVHVLDYDDVSIDEDAARHRGRHLLAAAAAELPPAVPRPCLEVAVGRPVDALLELARQERADVLVMGHRGRGLDRRVFGSVSTEVAHRSPVPVLIGGALEPTAGQPRR